eukprot:5387959-Pyramimonas_sp.AAC.1
MARAPRCKSALTSRRPGIREQGYLLLTHSAPFSPDGPCVFLRGLLASTGARKAVREQGHLLLTVGE